MDPPPTKRQRTAYAAGYEGEPVLGSKPRIRVCKRLSGPNRPLRVQSVVKQLMNEQTLLFQSLNNGITLNNNSWRVNGIMPLNSRYTQGSNSVWPRTLQFPVYIYRLSAASGNQLNATTGVVNNCMPLVQFRLQGAQSSDGEPWVYRWLETNPSNNSDPTYNTRNVMNVIEKETPFNTDKIFHHFTEATVLLTAPTFNTVNVNIDVIQFSEEEMAPPDDYLQNIASTATTSIDHGFAGITDEIVSNDYYSTWLFNKSTHPCCKAYKPRNIVGPPPFRVLKRHTMALGNRDTATADTGGLQYMHKEVMRPTRWYKTYTPSYGVPSAGPDVDPNGSIDQSVCDRSKGVGVIPQTTQQKWLMISAFGTPALVGGTQPSAVAFLPGNEASFDISIRSKFKCINSGSFTPVLPTALRFEEEEF